MSGGLEPKLNACAIGKKAYTNPQKNKQWDSGLKRDGYPLKSSWSANMLFIAFIAFPIPASCGFLTLEPQALPRTSLRNVQPITVQCTKGGRGCNELACELRDKSFISPAKTHED